MCKPRSTSLDTLELTSENRSKKGQKCTSELFRMRQKSKAISKSINGKMCYLNSDIHKDYQSAYYCNDYLFQDGDKMKAKFCRKRNCIICSRIKSAEYMSGYAPALIELDDLYLVTLTRPNVDAEMLRPEIDIMRHLITQIKDYIRKTYKIKIVGLRKFEVTYNGKTFNPHYHLLIAGKVEAELFRDEWLKRSPNAKCSGQDVRPIKSVKGLLEVFKYVTKAIVKDHFDPNAMDEMYKAIKGVRTIQPMGIKKAKIKKDETYSSTVITHRDERIDVWKWCNKKNDWYTINGEKLNDGYISTETKRVVKIINETTADARDRQPFKEQYEYDYSAREIIRQAGGRRSAGEHDQRSSQEDDSHRLGETDPQVSLDSSPQNQNAESGIQANLVKEYSHP